MPLQKNPIVKIKDVFLTYNQGKPTEFKALKNINLEIYPEEFVIFFGPSGSGKSTLLYLIAGLEMPSTGTVSVGNKDNLTNLTPQEMIDFHRSYIGMIFQAFYLIPSLSAKDNVLLPMVFAGIDPAQREQVGASLLERFGISDFKDRTPSRLSGGQQQRVAIARSLVNNPSLVLADEPVGNLDSKNAEIVLDLIADLKNKDKKTVILVTHDPSHLHKADRVFYIKDGNIVKVANQKEDKHHGYEAFKDAEKGSAAGENKEQKSQTLLGKLAVLYPNLSKEELLSKLLVYESLVPYDIEILEKTEALVAKYIKKEIDAKELYKQLDESTANGGVSLYEQTAQKLLKSIMEVTKEIKVIDSAKLNIKEIVEFVLEDHPVKLTPKQKSVFEEKLKSRIEAKLSAEEFAMLLDLPLIQGGVGLNKRTAEHFAKKIELLIVNKIKGEI